jgi:hypothetical protein
VVGVGRILPVVGGGMLVDFVDSFVGGYGLGMGLLIDDRIGGSLMRRIAGCWLLLKKEVGRTYRD